MKISLIQPSRNTLKYLKWSYNSIRKNQGDHEVEICVLDDASIDGTDAWCKEMSRTDSKFKWYKNETGVRWGHTIGYDFLINNLASNDICMIFHADMYLCPGALDEIEKYIKPGTIVSLTRIEPALHPPGPEKIILNNGSIEPELFDEDAFLDTLHDIKNQNNGKLTCGIFAPWAVYKSDFLDIGGHDETYQKQSKEDSDIFNRFELNGIKFIQTWNGYVYHVTCRGSRFNTNLTDVGTSSAEWKQNNIWSERNFIRKWGSSIDHDKFMKPIIHHKYNRSFVIKNCNYNLLYALEPWCDKIYVDCEFDQYIKNEQGITPFNLKERIFPINEEKTGDIIIEFDGNLFTKESVMIIGKLSEILTDSGELGTFNIDIFTITINALNHYEKELIVCKNKGWRQDFTNIKLA